MLKDRILSTLHFFDLQDFPLTLLELHRYLVANLESIKPTLDEHYELKNIPEAAAREKIPIDAVLQCLDSECSEEVACKSGFYALKNRGQIIDQRLQNYL